MYPENEVQAEMIVSAAMRVSSFDSFDFGEGLGFDCG